MVKFRYRLMSCYLLKNGKTFKRFFVIQEQKSMKKKYWKTIRTINHPVQTSKFSTRDEYSGKEQCIQIMKCLMFAIIFGGTVRE